MSGKNVLCNLFFPGIFEINWVQGTRMLIRYDRARYGGWCKKWNLQTFSGTKKHLTTALMMNLGTDSNGHRRKWWFGKMLQRAVSSDLLNCLLHECSHRCHSSNVNLSASNISFSQEIDVVLNLISLVDVNHYDKFECDELDTVTYSHHLIIW